MKLATILAQRKWNALKNVSCNPEHFVVTLNFLLFVDGVDGKQARRTNSSTPLGELFDHGLDSWACIFFVATVYSIFGRGESGVGVKTLYYILWVVLFSFILSHWEKYNTGILFLPWGYDISQVVRIFDFCRYTMLSEALYI